MKTLKQASRGPRVRQWQLFLRGQGYRPGPVDGVFGLRTHRATMAFQQRAKLLADGIVGNRTLAAAMLCGMEVVDESTRPNAKMDGPPRPDFPPLRGNQSRSELFGTFRYEPAPTDSNPERIRVLDGWAAANIVRVELPQLVTLGLRKRPTVQAHRLAAQPLQQLWQAWEDAGLLHYVLAFNGTYAARFVRGSRRTLSNHAFGTAFDINASYNRLGTTPAGFDAQGTVRPLVALANAHGFYWGGHYKQRPDGMHFELSRLTKSLRAAA